MRDGIADDRIDDLREMVGDMRPLEAIDYLLCRVEDFTRAAGLPVHIEGLTPLQSRMVHAMMRAKGAPVSRSALMDAMYWEPRRREDPDDGIVNVEIHHIRRRRPDLVIKTHFGIGYSIDASASL